MKELWNQLSKRINALALRERFLLFAAVVVVLGAITHQVFIAPLTRLQTQRAQEIDKRSEVLEAQRMRIEHDLARSRRARMDELQAQLARTQQEIDEVEREIARLSGSATDAAALRAVMTRALGRRATQNVTLVRVSTVQSPAASAAGTAPGAGSGVDIVLAGGYVDLMEYLATLEAALPEARWSALRLNAETVPPQVSIRIATARGAPR